MCKPWIYAFFGVVLRLFCLPLLVATPQVFGRSNFWLKPYFGSFMRLINGTAMNRNDKKHIVFIIAVGFSQRITTERHKALATTQQSFLYPPNTCGLVTNKLTHWLPPTDKTVSPFFPVQFPKFEHIATMRIKTFIEILKLFEVLPFGEDYSRLFVFSGVHEGFAV